MPQTKPIISIENVVASASIEQKLNLDKIINYQSKFNVVNGGIKIFN